MFSFKYTDLVRVVIIAMLISGAALGQSTPISERLADTAMNRIWVDERNQPGIPPKWTYEQGVVL